MTPHAKPYLGLPEELCDLETARVVIVPFGYEGGVSYGKGAAAAPDAVLNASQYLELYDEVLDDEPCRVGIATLEQPEIPAEPEAMCETLAKMTGELLDRGKFVAVIGGDHSITSGYVQALADHHEEFGVLQLDAHADLRDTYEGSPMSHACVMARIREITPHTLQIGIRSLSAEEARLAKDRNLSLCTMHRFRKNGFDLDAALQRLPQHLFITVDVDVFDWSVIASTGTPEPGGMLWDECMDLLAAVFHNKTVIGFDVVELAHRDHDSNSPFATAKLIYKMIGMRFCR
ncbi:agmatinase [Desulfosarcina widdelii]|uniref:Agmatinase n=1 Tax=Desulfosarcina widdelii TaxID=947919 RepID=A0A5K7ZFB5_9BACT|nr:agmatinase [Desulfosarcina widdelii]BBO74797.1 agmatinase [Desulfosarcina widdelii]